MSNFATSWTIDFRLLWSGTFQANTDIAQSTCVAQQAICLQCTGFSPGSENRKNPLHNRWCKESNIAERLHPSFHSDLPGRTEADMPHAALAGVSIEYLENQFLSFFISVFGLSVVSVPHERGMPRTPPCGIMSIRNDVHPAISSSVSHFSSALLSLPALAESFPMGIVNEKLLGFGFGIGSSYPGA